MKLTYLTVDALAVAVPFIFSFHPKIRFYKTWKALFTALTCVAVPFLVFDSIFTACGVWSFNPSYIMGLFLLNLPLEEWLFFICIPFSCLFTFFCLDKFYDLSWNPKAENIFCILFSGVLFITGMLFIKRVYTSSTFITTAILCFTLKFILDVKWFGKAIVVFVVLMLPLLLVDGVLTGTGLPSPVVSYNPSYILGIRIKTIPVEDFIYGFELFVLNLALYLRLQARLSLKQISP